MKTRKELEKILKKYIKNDALINHSRMVASALGAYAKHLGKPDNELERWYATGLLHDIDWEAFPDDHPNKAIKEILPSEGINDPVILQAIAAHAPARTGIEAETELDRYLFASDELSGFIHAVSLLRPTGYKGMKVKSVKKRLKSKSFAAGVSREDVYKGVELIGSTLEDHVSFLIGVFGEE